MPILFSPNPDPYRPHLPSWRQPLYLHLSPLWRSLASALGTSRGRVLDVGCGMQPYRQLLRAAHTEYVGLDRQSPLSNPTVVGDLEQLPFADQSFDVVLATQVLEHLPKPELGLKEAVRVLRPGGRLIVTVPGVWPTHEAPHDYSRFTRFGLTRLLDEQGVRVVELKALGGLWATVGQMINLALYRNLALRELVPLVNLAADALEAVGTREELVLNWFVEGTRDA